MHTYIHIFRCDSKELQTWENVENYKYGLECKEKKIDKDECTNGWQGLVHPVM